MRDLSLVISFGKMFKFCKAKYGVKINLIFNSASQNYQSKSITWTAPRHVEANALGTVIQDVKQARFKMAEAKIVSNQTLKEFERSKYILELRIRH